MYFSRKYQRKGFYSFFFSNTVVFLLLDFPFFTTFFEFSWTQTRIDILDQ